MSKESPGNHKFDANFHLDDLPNHVFGSLQQPDDSLTPPPTKRRKMCLADDINDFYSEAQVNLLDYKSRKAGEINEEEESSETDTLKSISVLRSAEHIDNVSENSSLHCSHLIDLNTRSASATACNFELCQISKTNLPIEKEAKVFGTILPQDDTAIITPRTLEIPCKKRCFRGISPKPKSIFTKAHCSDVKSDVSEDLDLEKFFQDDKSFSLENWAGVDYFFEKGDNFSDSLDVRSLVTNLTSESSPLELKSSVTHVTSISSPSARNISKTSEEEEEEEEEEAEEIFTDCNVTQDTSSSGFVNHFSVPAEASKSSSKTKTKSLIPEILDSFCKLLSQTNLNSTEPDIPFVYQKTEHSKIKFLKRSQHSKFGLNEETPLEETLSEMAQEVFKVSNKSEKSNDWPPKLLKSETSHRTFSEVAATININTQTDEEDEDNQKESRKSNKSNFLIDRRPQATELSFYNVEEESSEIFQKSFMDSDDDFKCIEDEEQIEELAAAQNSCCPWRFCKLLFFHEKKQHFFR